MEKVKEELEITKEVQEVIDYVLEHELNVEFKVCTECGWDLPCHDWFISKHKQGKNGRASQCKECISVLRENGTYKFTNNLREVFYENIKDDFVNKFRYMSIGQLQNKYELSFNEITKLIQRYKLNKSKINDSYTNEEIVFMYNSLINKEIEKFTNGIYNHDKYIIILIEYMINNILKWDREDICNNFSLKTFKDNGLGGLLGIKKFIAYDYLIKSFPEYNIMPWELRSSSVGNGFWTKDNVDKVLNWLKDKLLKDKGIESINFAGTFGFSNLLDEYNLLGLCATTFNGYVPLFERMYNETFSKEEMLKGSYKFNIDKECVSISTKSKIYKLTDIYYNLDDRGKTLINEIAKFCDKEGRFPKEKEMMKANGYIARSQYYKYFNENTFKKVYEYISPFYDFSNETDVDKFRDICDGQNYEALYIPPLRIRCVKCGTLKDFTRNNFPSCEAQKFGLKYKCIQCETESAYESNLEEFATRNKIAFIDRYNIIVWYEAYLENRLKQMPNFCYEESNIIKIIKYIINNKMDLITKDQICDVKLLGTQQFNNYRIDMSINRLGGKLKALQKCFPELNITEDDVFPETYTEDDVNNIICEWINNNDFTVLDLFKKGLSYTYSKKMTAMLSVKFHAIGLAKTDMIMWYCDRNNILHPEHNRKIIKWDFEEMVKGFWENTDNLVDRIKYYCEHECLDNILDSMNDTDLLKAWIYKYFRQSNINNIIPYGKKGYSLYTILIESYPELKENNLLFDWEWHQFEKSDKPTLIRTLRELVEFRLDKYIINPIVDIPIYISRAFISVIYPKFQHQIAKKRFDTYYQWCCEAYPEYANSWKPEDFGLCVAFDGTRCGSIEEKMVYEFFKAETSLDIEAIGFIHTGENVFILPDEHEDNKYCPDFVAHRINENNNIFVFDKPLYIEYYGWYVKDNPSKMFVEYVNKTDRKNEFYKNNSDILFLDIYPCDLKNSFKTLKDKYNSLIQSITI